MSRLYAPTGVQLIYCADNTLFEFDTSTSYTFTLWVKHSILTGNQNYVRKDPGGFSSRNIYAFRLSGTALNFLAGNVSGPGPLAQVSGTHGFAVGTWYFAAAVRDVAADTLAIYTATSTGGLALIASGNDNSTVTHGSNASSLDFGFYQPSAPTEIFRGTLGDITMWNVAKTSAELDDIRQGAIISGAGLIGYWPMCGDQSPEPDLSGNGNNATVSGPTKGATSAPYSICSDAIAGGGGGGTGCRYTIM